jgi:Raf kinase inhibitor-like YbhB/YbcL family protein
MKLWSNSFQDGKLIPVEHAFGAIDPAAHVKLSGNRNPHLAWSGIPEKTASLALICHDCDVPSRGDDVNAEGRSVPADLPRVDFFHWTLIDLPVDFRQIEVGQFSASVTPRGKPGPTLSRGSGLPAAARHGLNDYTGWFASDREMSGKYFGYDGPCPPWNDTIVHHYVFTLFALDVARLPVDGDFTGAQVRAAMSSHILAEAKVSGVYSLNPTVASTLR